jgi:hypothetical protein
VEELRCFPAETRRCDADYFDDPTAAGFIANESPGLRFAITILAQKSSKRENHDGLSIPKYDSQETQKVILISDEGLPFGGSTRRA